MDKEQAVLQAVRNIDGISKLLSRREIKELPSLLWEDELPEAIISGTYGTSNGLLVATNKRAIFIDKGLFSLHVEDFPYDKISSIEYKTGMLMGEVDIYASGNKAEIKYVPKDQVRPFGEFLRARITSHTPHKSVPAASSGSPTHIDQRLAALERLAALKAQGILSDAEFESEKQNILGVG